jgi:DoxX-like family
VKDSKTLYWILTGLAAAFMLLASIPDVLQVAQAVSIFSHLGYPAYVLPFLGTAKTLGAVAVLVPGLQRLKEWAFAGLVFDLIGAVYSHLSVGDPPSAWMLPVVGLILVSAAYLSYEGTRAVSAARTFVFLYRTPPMPRARQGRCARNATFWVSFVHSAATSTTTTRVQSPHRTSFAASIIWLHWARGS